MVPNFFIIGSLKCGTTSMAAYLLDHPEIFMPGVWELNYLASDLKWVGVPPAASDEDYLQHFAQAKQYPRVGEKSAFYLFSRNAARQIHELNPNAKIICMLRDPVKLLWSLFRYNIANLEEDLLSFSAALDAENERSQGLRIPTTGSIAQNLFYREIVCFTEQLQRYFETFGRENVLVIAFDDFTSKPARIHQQTLEFLGVSPQSLPTYGTHNQGVGDLSFVGVRRFLRNHPILKNVMERLTSLSVRKHLRTALRVARGGEAKTLRKMDENLRVSLCQELRPEVDRLSQLINRDLSHWCRV